MTNPPPTRPWAEARLTTAHNYWLASTRPDSRPHLVPIWGVWIDERFWFASFAAVKVDNVAAQPAVMLSTETPGEVVILDGTCARVTEAELPSTYATAFDEKYGAGWSGVGDSSAIHLRIVPIQIRAWNESEASSPPARFRF